MKQIVRVAFAILLVASLVPIWLVRYHPIADLANHLAATSVWLHINDPSWDVANYYKLELGLNPYWGYYAPMRVLAPLFGLDVANRLVLSLYIVSLPLGFAWLLKRFDRDPALALFAFPFLWTFSFTLGFVHTFLGLGLCPAAIAAFDAYCERPSIARGVVAFLLGAAIYFCHIVPFLLFLGCAGLVGLLYEPRDARSLARRVIVWGAVLLVAILVSRFGSGKGMGSSVASYSFSWERNPLTMLAHIYDWSFANCTGHEDEIMVSILGVAWLLLMAAGTRPRTLPSFAPTGAAHRRAPVLHQLRPYACALAALLGYLLLPKSVVSPAYSWGIKYRIAPFALLFLVLLVPREQPRFVRALSLSLAFVVGLGFAIDTTLHWREAQAFTSGFDEAVGVIPMGKRALFLMGDPLSGLSVRQRYAQSWPSFYQAFHGGYNPWLFDDFPVRFRVKLPAPDLYANDFRWATQAPYYDYIVLFAKDASRVFGPHVHEAQLIKSAGKWSVYKLPGPRMEMRLQ